MQKIASVHPVIKAGTMGIIKTTKSRKIPTPKIMASTVYSIYIKWGLNQYFNHDLLWE